MVSFTPIFKTEKSIITQVYSVPIYVFIEDTINLLGKLEDFGIKIEKKGYRFWTKIENKENVHFRPNGEIKIFMGKTNIANLEIREGKPVYPLSSRKFYSEFIDPEVLKKGKYMVYLKMYYDENKVLCNKKYKLKVLKNNKTKLKRIK